MKVPWSIIHPGWQTGFDTATSTKTHRAAAGGLSSEALRPHLAQKKAILWELLVLLQMWKGVGDKGCHVA